MSLRVAAILLVLIACHDDDGGGPAVTPKSDPLGYGDQGAQWFGDLELDLGDRAGGAASRVRARVHAPEQPGTDLPVVVFAHDASIRTIAYTNLANHLASHGFVVVLPQFDTTLLRDGSELASDLVATLDALQATPPAFDGLTIAVDRFLVAGHGRGGRQAFLATSDPRVVAAFAIDPIDGDEGDGGLLLPDRVGRAPRPLALTGAGRAVGEGGCVDDDQGYAAIFEATPRGTLLWDLPSAGHDDVLDDCAAGSTASSCTTCPPGDDPNRASHAIRASLLTWAALYLDADRAYVDWTTTEDVAAYLPDATVRTKE